MTSTQFFDLLDSMIFVFGPLAFWLLALYFVLMFSQAILILFVSLTSWMTRAD
jgi:hypothetical protein